MSLIDYTYLTFSPVYINGLQSVNSGTDTNLLATKRVSVQSNIDILQPIFLKELLGITFRDAFLTGLSENPIMDKWTRLRDKLCVVTTTGTGNDAITTKKSIISDYVFCHIFNDPNAGDPVIEGTEDIIRQKVSRIWNSMLENIKEIYDFIRENPDDYAEYGCIYGFNMSPMNALGI